MYLLLLPRRPYRKHYIQKCLHQETLENVMTVSAALLPVIVVVCLSDVVVCYFESLTSCCSFWTNCSKYCHLSCAYTSFKRIRSLLYWRCLDCSICTSALHTCTRELLMSCHSFVPSKCFVPCPLEMLVPQTSIKY